MVVADRQILSFSLAQQNDAYARRRTAFAIIVMTICFGGVCSIGLGIRFEIF